MSQFPEEQLNLSVSEGFGYFPAYPGLKVGEHYEVVRKLGYGPRSSIWLVKDLLGDNGYLALKILTAHATLQNTHELEILEMLKKLPHADLSKLCNHFTEKSHHGEHLCLGLNVAGPSVEELRLSSPTKTLPVHVVQRVIASVVEQLSELHESLIIHGAVMGSNFLFFVGESKEDVEEELEKLPPCKVETKITVDKVEYPIVRSQPIPHGYEWNEGPDVLAMSGIDLVNYGHAQKAKSSPTFERSNMNRSLCPPEAVLRIGYGITADIWMLGCATFELLTGQPLVPEGEVKDDGSLLSWLMAMSGDSFKPHMGLKSKLGETYFDENGAFKTGVGQETLESRLSSGGNIPEKDIAGVVGFIQRCLKLDPADRPTAYELIGDEWLEPGFACSCAFC